MKQNIEMCCSVFKTFDYGLFKNIKGNRELNPKNYKKILILATQNFFGKIVTTFR